MRKKIARVLGAAALFGWACSAPAETATIKMAGVVVSQQSGDVACYLGLREDSGKQSSVMAGFELCNPSIKGKRVELILRESSVLADSCQGNPACKKTKRAWVAVEARRVEASAVNVSAKCSAVEELMISCELGHGEKMAVCWGPSGARATISGPARAWLEPYEKPAMSVQGGSEPFAGGGMSWLALVRPGERLVVYSGVGKWGKRGEVLERSGMEWFAKNGQKRDYKCLGGHAGALGPDWLERKKIKAGLGYEMPE